MISVRDMAHSYGLMAASISENGKRANSTASEPTSVRMALRSKESGRTDARSAGLARQTARMTAGSKIMTNTEVVKRTSS